jgi:hypothetical protein
MVLPGLLDWIFSFLKEIDNPFQLVGAGGAGGDGSGGVTQVIVYAPEEPSYWLFIGLRGGVGLKMLADPQTAFYKPTREIPPLFVNTEGEPETYLSTMNIINAAFTFTWMFPDNALFASPFGLQAEVIFNYDLSDGKGDHNTNLMTIAFAGVLRTHLYRKGTTAITLLTGGYYALAPLNSDDFQKQVLGLNEGFGLTGGINIGNKMGAGYLYLELRYMGDWFFRTAHEREGGGFIRHLAGLCIGYEFGIIQKKK